MYFYTWFRPFLLIYHLFLLVCQPCFFASLLFNGVRLVFSLKVVQKLWQSSCGLLKNLYLQVCIHRFFESIDLCQNVNNKILGRIVETLSQRLYNQQLVVYQANGHFSPQ